MQEQKKETEMDKFMDSMAQLSERFGLRKSSNKKSTKLSMIGGVFTPDVLTILGVIMYLRLGWVVGNAGLLGALAIIVLAKLITIATALSMSSITTNIKIGAGGAYSIISKSLGLEAGGSIGIPFYISQTLSAALYIVGFTEGWLRIFPDHPALLISMIVWGLVIVIASVSVNFAIRVQYIIMAIIGFSILSFFLLPNAPVENVPLVGNFEDADFWLVFAIFFPAVTGIMAGANLSGDLKNPRRAIPIGTLSAIAVTMVIYISMTFVAAKFIPAAELRGNQMVMVDNSWWGPAVLMGILAATFSSALGSVLGAPRILQALAEHRTAPFHTFFEKKTSRNEPLNAMVFTAGVIVLALIFGNLNALASLITMFFLITYGMINLVVFIQQSMQIISFRPTFKIPRFVSLFGAVGCGFVMFLINPVFSFVAILIIIGLYFWLGKRELKSDWGDIRGGMFLVLAERASRLAAQFPRHQISWKPDLLVPIDDPEIWTGSLLFIRNIVYPSGSIFAFTVREDHIDKTDKALAELVSPLKNQNLMVHHTTIEDSSFLHGSRLVIQTLKAGAMRPNSLFLTVGSNPKKDETIRTTIQYASESDLGIVLLFQHPRLAFGMQKDVNIWLRDKSPNWHLAMLIALQINLNWEGKLNLITVAQEQKDERRLHNFLEKISDKARLPSMTEFYVLTGQFKDALQTAPNADINMFGFADTVSFDFMREIPKLTKSSCLYVKDSGLESALV